MLNQGKEPDDVFEEELLHCGASSGGSKLYRQWVGNLKKGGGALIVTCKTTANKATKYHSKFGLKNLLSKEHSESHGLQRGGSVCGPHTYRLIQSDCLQNRLPITQHFGRSRPRRPARKHGSNWHERQMQDINSTCEDSATVEPEQCSGSSELQDDDDFSLANDPEEMDLLGEIFDTLSAQSCREPGLLYSTRSLDLFSSDSTEFISRRSLTAPSQESLSPSAGNGGSLMSWEEELEEGLDDQKEESAVLIDRPEKELEESLCLDVPELKVDCEEQDNRWLAQDRPVNGTTDEERLDTGRVETKTQEVNEEQLIKEDVEQYQKSPEKLLCEAKHTPETFQGPTNTDMVSTVSVSVKERSDKAAEAVFQQRVSQTGSSSDSAVPEGTGFRGQEISRRTAFRSHNIQAASSRLVMGTQTDEQCSKPLVSSTPHQLQDEEQDLMPIKVSELKKRFEH